MKVIKRNNDIVDFNDSKIFNAVKKAFISTRGATYYNLDEDCYDITKSILMEISDMDQDYYSVEEIQDTVENILMNLGYNDVAKNYIIYREQKREKRERKSKLYDLTQDKIQDVMNTVGIENDNANVDEASFSGKNNKVASYVLKEYALNNLIRPEIAQYHRDGRLYTHDLDKYASGMHNCLIIDFEDLFREDGGGFKTRNADVRRPNDITTFFQLVAVAFQIQSQCQYGGVGSGRIDFEAAPFVAITFKKEYKRILMDRWDFTEQKANEFIEEYDVRMSNEELKEIPFFEKAYDIAVKNTEKKCRQGAESLYHNLNTLESRAGSQVNW